MKENIDKTEQEKCSDERNCKYCKISNYKRYRRFGWHWIGQGRQFDRRFRRMLRKQWYQRISDDIWEYLRVYEDLWLFTRIFVGFLPSDSKELWSCLKMSKGV